MHALELKVPPIFVLAVLAILAWVLNLALPHSRFHNAFAFPAAAALLAGGSWLLLACAFRFFRTKTTVDPRKPEMTNTLVTGGLYGYSRNPMYLGFALILLAGAVGLSNAVAFTVVPGFIFFIHRFQIRPEERILEAKFGEDYRAYKRRVRAWI